MTLQLGEWVSLLSQVKVTAESLNCLKLLASVNQTMSTTKACIAH